MMSVGVAAFGGRELKLELLDPNSEQLVRLFRHPGGEWEPPPKEHRNLRVDPPVGHKADYAVLYTAGTLPAVAMECRVLSVDNQDRYTWLSHRASQYHIARYDFSKPALFIPIDGSNRNILGLQGGTRKFVGYEPYQEVALTLFQRYGQVVHGLSWESFHRNQPGRVFALWHQHKETIGLRLRPPSLYARLIDDPEWQQFLADYPEIEEVTLGA